MAYIGTSPSNGVRRVNTFTATANQTSFSVVYADTNYIDVHQNGVLLATDDYTSTTGTTVVLAQGASADDVVVITVYDVFSVADTVSKTAGGTFDGGVTMGGTLAVTGAVNLSTKLATTNLATGAVVQVVGVVTGAAATGTTVLPHDDTIPQKTEGIEVMTLAITPTNASNKLFIQVTALGSVAVVNRYVVMALFQDDTANALSATATFESVSTGLIVTPLNHFMTAGTTSETTFKVRMGDNAGGTFTFNGDNGGRMFGGVANSSITITEIAV
tara:strand:- start:24 stop:842 length:819 start_codon:yes stop_codon:yes gene_type:complete